MKSKRLVVISQLDSAEQAKPTAPAADFETRPMRRRGITSGEFDFDDATPYNAMPSPGQPAHSRFP